MLSACLKDFRSGSVKINGQQDEGDHKQNMEGYERVRMGRSGVCGLLSDRAFHLRCVLSYAGDYRDTLCRLWTDQSGSLSFAGAGIKGSIY